MEQGTSVINVHTGEVATIVVKETFRWNVDSKLHTIYTLSHPLLNDGVKWGEWEFEKNWRRLEEPKTE